MRQFVESLKRLYDNQDIKAINRNKIIELYNNKKITENEKQYILGE